MKSFELWHGDSDHEQLNPSSAPFPLPSGLSLLFLQSSVWQNFSLIQGGGGHPEINKKV